MSWRKEKKEHPWATKKQAKRIAADHQHAKHETKEHRHEPQKGGFPAVQAATRDLAGLTGNAQTIAKHAGNP